MEMPVSNLGSECFNSFCGQMRSLLVSRPQKVTLTIQPQRTYAMFCLHRSVKWPKLVIGSSNYREGMCRSRWRREKNWNI